MNVLMFVLTRSGSRSPRLQPGESSRPFAAQHARHRFQIPQKNRLHQRMLLASSLVSEGQAPQEPGPFLEDETDAEPDEGPGEHREVAADGMEHLHRVGVRASASAQADAAAPEG